MRSGHRCGKTIKLMNDVGWVVAVCYPGEESYHIDTDLIRQKRNEAVVAYCHRYTTDRLKELRKEKRARVVMVAIKPFNFAEGVVEMLREKGVDTRRLRRKKSNR